MTSISAGLDHSLAVKADGTVWAWGDNWVGQLGDGTRTDRHTPVQVTSLSGVKAVSAGGWFSLALKSSGTMWAWGINDGGQLGNTSVTTFTTTPVQVSSISGVQAIEAGPTNSGALTSDGRVWAWGDNGSGQVGNGSTTNRLTPYQLAAPTQAVPGVPSELTAVPGEQLAYLTWEAPESAVTQYVITPHINGVVQPEIGTGSARTSYAVRNLVEGTTYSFAVAAQNCLGTGSATVQSKRIVPTGVQLSEQGFTIERQPLTDRIGFGVNAHNGNLKLSATDLAIAGTGLDLVVTRSYNSRAGTSSIFGSRWTTSLGEVKLDALADGSMLLRGPDGANVGFAKEVDGTYTPPSGVGADLKLDENGTPSVPGDDTYELKWWGSDERWVFAAADGKLLSRADRNANKISYTYAGPAGAISEITDTQGRSTTIAYNDQDLVGQITDPIGRQHVYNYTGSNLTHYRDPSGGETFFTYDAQGNLTRITTPAERVVEFGYDGFRRATSLRWPLAAGSPTTTLAYGDKQTVVTDANGKATTYAFDPAGRTTAVTDALGATTSLDYTSHSNVRRYTSGGGGATTFGYTPAHALTNMSLPTGAEYMLEYGDPNHPHLPTRIKDPQGNRLVYSYDTVGNLRSQVADQMPSQNRVDITYGAKGMPATTSDPNGNTTAYSYDTAGNLARITPPAPLGATEIVYDAASRPKTVRDGRGQLATYTYDALDRVTAISYADGSSVERSYDPDGKLIRITDPSGDTVMTYDAMGRMTQRATPGGLVSYVYDKVGNLTSLTDDGGTVSYTFNAANLPVSARTPDGLTTTMTYDAGYNRTSLRHPNGVTVNHTYDSTNRLTGLAAVKSSDTLLSFTYSYRNPSNGNQDGTLRYSQTEMDGTKTDYTYDRLNRLTEAWVSRSDTSLVRVHSYTYDGAGNRLQADVDRPNPELDSVTFGEYNAANQLTVLDQAEEMTYDANGNLVGSNRGRELTYTAADQTTSIRPRPDQGVRTEFSYRGSGQAERYASATVARRVGTDGPVCVPPCVPDPGIEVALTTFGHSVLGVASQTTAGLSTYYTRDPAGSLLSQRTPVGTQYLITDAIGSVVAVTDAEGRSLASYRYDPFGAAAEVTGDPAVTPWRYAGAYLDATGLYHMGERYYDPALGRFTQQDPIHNPLDPKLWNRYVYVGNDPINFIDPSGLSGCALAGGTEGFVVGVEVIRSFVYGAVLGGGIAALIGKGLIALGVSVPVLGPVVAAAALLVGAAAAIGKHNEICKRGSYGGS